MRRPRRVVTRDELLNRVWHLPTPAETNVLEVHISSLRHKLRDGDKKLIRTVRGVGYSLGGELDTPVVVALAGSQSAGDGLEPALRPDRPGQL